MNTQQAINLINSYRKNELNLSKAKELLKKLRDNGHVDESLKLNQKGQNLNWAESLIDDILERLEEEIEQELLDAEALAEEEEETESEEFVEVTPSIESGEKTKEEVALEKEKQYNEAIDDIASFFESEGLSPETIQEITNGKYPEIFGLAEIRAVVEKYDDYSYHELIDFASSMKKKELIPYQTTLTGTGRTRYWLERTLEQGYLNGIDKFTKFVIAQENKESNLTGTKNDTPPEEVSEKIEEAFDAVVGEESDALVEDAFAEVTEKMGEKTPWFTNSVILPLAGGVDWLFNLKKQRSPKRPKHVKKNPFQQLIWISSLILNTNATDFKRMKMLLKQFQIVVSGLNKEEKNDLVDPGFMLNQIAHAVRNRKAKKG